MIDNLCNTVPVVNQSVPDYSVLASQQPALLYAFRTDMHITELRTLTNIGIQDMAGGEYTCVAINGQRMNSTNVIIQPTGE